LIRHSVNPRPSSYPFISGDTFRSIANHIHESGRENPDGKDRTFNPKKVNYRDIVFVDGAYIENYFKDVHPHITNQYILITHNNDWNVTEKELGFIDNKIIHWFAQNVLVFHSKVTPIPIGLENAHFANAGYIPLYSKLSPQDKKRLPRILAGFNVASNKKERSAALETLSRNLNVDIIKKRLNQNEYVSLIKKYSFVASPPGNGEDCIRTWEAMLFGTIPIVKRSIGIEYFEKLNLPLFIIDSWDELNNLSEYDLKSKYDLIMSQADRRPLYMDYWLNLIKSK